MSASSKLIQNFLSLSAAEVIIRVLQSLLSLYMARLLGVGVYGQIGFAIAVTSYFALLSDFGLTTLGIRDIAGDKSVTNRYFSNILVIQLLLSGILLLLLIAVLFLFSFGPQLNLLILFFALASIPSAFNLTYILQAYEQMHRVAIVKIIVQLCITVAVFLGLWIWRNPIVIPLAQLVGGVIGVMFIAYIVKRYVAVSWEKVSLSSIRSFGSLAFPFVATAFFIQLYFNIDAVLLKLWKGDVEVGYYSAAYKLVVLMMLVATLVVSSLLPRLVDLWKHKREAFFDLVLTVIRLLGLFITLVVIIGFAYTYQLIEFLYGHEYLPAAFPMMILMGYLWLKFFSIFLDAPLVAIGQQKAVSVAVAGAALLNFVLNVIFIPQFGMVAAAYCTVIAELSALAYLVYCFKKYTGKIYIIDYIKHPLLCAAPLIIWIVITRSWPWMLSAGIGCLLYLMCAYLLKALPLSQLVGLLPEIFGKNRVLPES